jgi:hypothetical protein
LAASSFFNVRPGARFEKTEAMPGKGLVLRCEKPKIAMSQLAQTEPPSFVAGTAELASIADAGEAWRPSTVGRVIVAAGAPQKPAATAAGRHLSGMAQSLDCAIGGGPVSTPIKSAALSRRTPKADIGQRSRRMQKAFVATMNGIFAEEATGTVSGEPVQNDVIHDVSGVSYTAGVTDFNAGAFLDTLVAMGDSMDELG